MVDFTKEQQLAVDTRNKNIIVSAQAGAGKTQVLVGRIIGLLRETRIDISDMLIVTFTNKAAREMKDRIKSDLADLIEKGNLSEEEEIYFQDQYKKTNDAQISTMHSFGINVLREYFYKLALNPSFKTLTDTNLDILKWETMNQVFEELYKNESEELYKLLSIYSNKYSDEELKLSLFSIYNFMQSQLDPFAWLEKSINTYKVLEYYQDENKQDEFKNKIFTYYKNEFNGIYQDYLKAEEDIQNIFNQEFIYPKSRMADRDVIFSLHSAKNYDQLFSLIKQVEVITKDRHGKKLIEEKGLDKDDIKIAGNLMDSYRKNLKTLINDMQAFDLDKELVFENQVHKLLQAMEHVLKLYHEKFRENKNARQAIDFNDIEHYTLELLKDESVLAILRDKYKYIFFDEYQDSNQVQNEIIEKISSNNNLFFVGDIKQSIYKFRLADPLIFKERYKYYKTDNENNIAIDLYHNFRTERNLLNFNNLIFNKHMTDELGNVNYDTYEHRLAPGKDSDKYDDESTKISLNFIENMDKDEEDELKAKIDRELLNINPEALLVGKKIKEIVHRKKKLDEEKASKEKDSEKAEESKEEKTYYNKIAILARSKTIFPDIIKVLEMEKIPYFYESSGFSYEDIEIKAFIEILKAIDNDQDDITLLSVLTSPLVNMTDDELAHIRYDDKDHSFNYCFRNYSQRKDANENIKEKIETYNDKIEEYRDLERKLSLEKLAWFVLSDSGYLSYILSKDNGDRILSNMKLFIDEIKEIESGSFQSLSSLVSYLKFAQKKDLTDRESNAELSEEDDVVRLMTMHKSKGLQFDTCLIVNAGKGMNTMDLRESFIMNEGGISLKVYDPDTNKLEEPISYKLIKSAKKDELLSEEMRILYVAMTRAEREIHLLSKGKAEGYKIEKDDPKKMNSYHDWIYSALEASQKEINELNIKYNFENINSADLYKEAFLNEDQDKSSEKSSKENKDFEEKVAEKLEKVFNFDYDTSMVNLPYKKTVTEISAKDDNKESDFREYEKLTDKEVYKTELLLQAKFIEKSDDLKLDPLAKGSLYHYLFEKLPIKAMSEKDLDQFFANMLENKFISHKEFGYIDKKLFIDFINHPIFAQLVEAKENNKLYRESSFTMKYDDEGHPITVDGQIDLFFEDDLGFTILDFKTNKIVDESLYIKQLNLYAQALEKATGKKVVNKLIYWVMSGQLSEI